MSDRMGQTMDDASGQLPLYQRVKRDLVRAISRGEYVPDQPFITQREVCDRFDVSTATAVRALNELVTEGYLIRRRGKGTFVAQRRPDPVRPASAERTVAYIGHPQGPHPAAVISGVETACASLGYAMLIFDPKGTAAGQDRALQRALTLGVSGVVLYPTQDAVDSPALAELRHHGIPVVMVDRYMPDVATDAVLADDFAAGYDLTSYLIDHGHRHIATLWNETKATSERDRFSGHLRALREHGLQILPELTPLTSYQELPEDQRQRILAGLLGRPESPTALLCANGYVLAAAAHDLSVLGHDVPGGIELACMDNAGPFDLLPLAMVAAVLPSQEMGSRAM